MRNTLTILILFSFSFNASSQNNKFISQYYVLDVQLHKSSPGDSISIDVTFKNTSKKSAFILDALTINWSFDKHELSVYLGDILINSRDSSQRLIEVLPDCKNLFSKVVPNYLNDSSVIQLLAGFVNTQNSSTKKEFIRKDFPRWQDFKYLHYSFMSDCN